MKRLTDRRTMLLAVGTATIVAATGAVSAQSADVSGTVEFEGGAVIPEGDIEIYVEDPAVRGNARRGASETRLRSDGGSKAIDFAFSPPTSPAASPSTQIVARLERADGWLLARGSAQLKTDSPVYIVLHAAMY